MPSIVPPLCSAQPHRLALALSPRLALWPSSFSALASLSHPHHPYLNPTATMYSQELVMQYVYQGWDRMLWSDARKVRSASASSTD